MTRPGSAGLAARLAGSGLPRPRQIVTVDDVAHGKPAPDPAHVRFTVGPAGITVSPA
ncbi:hypothetical protein [Modestobacter sp. SYSU DS0290]